MKNVTVIMLVVLMLSVGGVVLAAQAEPFTPADPFFEAARGLEQAQVNLSENGEEQVELLN
ncbi:MAG: hypothetical protein SCM57_12735, partial [Bacillota bacterium]|nr:hypothetical protein [Bacillota bacterium]